MVVTTLVVQKHPKIGNRSTISGSKKQENGRKTLIAGKPDMAGLNDINLSCFSLKLHHFFISKN